MSDWKQFRKKHYKKDVRELYAEEGCCLDGMIDFNPESMANVAGGEFRSYDEYLEVQKCSCGKTRRYFEICYYHEAGADAGFKGRILRFDDKKVLFKRIMVDGLYGDGTGFFGKEDHVWMDKADFAQFKPEDCVSFEAEVYRYMRKKDGKLIDYGLRNPTMITPLESYEVPTDEELINQQIDQLVCETCMYHDQCYSMCIANEQDRRERFETLKNLQPGKFTPLTVMLAYELEYRMMTQMGGFNLDPKDPNYEVVKRIVEICEAHPVYYVGDPMEAFYKMLYMEKPRLYVE